MSHPGYPNYNNMTYTTGPNYGMSVSEMMRIINEQTAQMAQMDQMDQRHYSDARDRMEMRPPAPKHRCLAERPEERHLDFQTGLLNFYRSTHPRLVEEIEKGTGCNNINCLIEHIKQRI